MTVTNVHRDIEALTLTITSEFAVGVDRLWQIWADPRQLERWWGPPVYPATVTEHDLSVGGLVEYYMTGPGGDRHHGWWRIIAVEAPTGLEFEDGFADDAGEPAADMPTTRTRVQLDDAEPGWSRMTVISTFPSVEAMQQILEMGAEEGMTLALGQIDAILAGTVAAP